MKYSTVIFDLDGTLLDTLEDLMDAVNYALDQYGFPKRTLPEIRRFVGNGVQKLVERSVPDGTAAPDAARILSSFRSYYSTHCMVKTHPYSGILELLRQLKDSGCRLAIVSNKPDSAVKTLNETYFYEYIRTAVGEKEGIRRKPAPDMVGHALAQLHSSKKEAVYVGDSEVDILTAASSGLDCISVSWGFRSAGFLREKGAGIIADTPQQVYQLIS